MGKFDKIRFIACTERLTEIFKYFDKNKEKEILNKIDYINFCVNFPDQDNSAIALPNLKVINRVSFEEENISLFKLLYKVDFINQVLINNESIFKDNLDFFLNKNIKLLVWNVGNLDNEEAENILKIKGLEYLIINKQLLKGVKIFENVKIKVIDEKYYIDDIYRL